MKKILILMTMGASVFLAGCNITTISYPPAETYCDENIDKSARDGTRNKEQRDLFQECKRQYNTLITGEKE